MEPGKRRTTPDDPAVRYLLGALGEEDQTAYEKALFRDGAAFAETEASEDELVDDYLSGALSPGERARFEEVYLASPERRQRLEFGRALAARLSGADARSAGMVRPTGPDVRAMPAFRQASLPAWLPIAAALFFGILGAYFAWDAARARRELDTERTRTAGVDGRQRDLERRLAETDRRGSQANREVEGLRQQVRDLGDRLAAADVARAGGGVVSFALDPILMRGGGASPSLALPATASAAVLVCPIENPRPVPYRVSLETPEGKVVWSGATTAPPPGVKSVAVVVPARVLAPGDYILTVAPEGSRERGGDFALRVRRG